MEAKLQTFRSPGRAEVRKLNFISLAVKQDGSADAELHIFGRIGRADVRNGTHITSLVVKAERRYGS